MVSFRPSGSANDNVAEVVDVDTTDTSNTSPVRCIAITQCVATMLQV